MVKNISVCLLIWVATFIASNSYSQQILCSFESDADVQSVVYSPGVTILQTTDFAALNAHSLKCEFHEKGGSLTISNLRLPSWMAALGEKHIDVNTLLLFIWSPVKDSVNISVEDSSATIAGADFILKSGANHLQLPFSKLGRLNSNKIKSLIISTKKHASLYVDYIALDQFQEALVNNGRWDVSYSDKIPTKHYSWGNDFINGKIKTYSISPIFDGRGIVELSERLPLDFKVTTIGRSAGINRWGFGDFYNRRNPSSDDGQHPYSLAFNYIADDLLSSDSFDIIIWPGIHPWETYPKYIRESIMKRVKEGAGLILLYPIGKNNSDFSDLSPLTLTNSINIDSIVKLNKKTSSLFGFADSSQWSDVKEHYITHGIPFNVFPFGKIAVLPSNANNSEVLLKTKNGNPVLAIKKYGKGRVVAMTYLESGLIPMLQNPWGTGLNYPYWEYMWSLLARSVVWAAGKESQTGVKSAHYTEGNLFVDFKNLQEGDSLLASVTDDFGLEEKNITIALNPKQPNVKIRLNNTLHSGKHIANLRLKGKKGIYDWYSTKFSIEATGEITSILIDQDEIQVGKQVRGNVSISAKKPFNGTLIAKLFDNYSRLADMRKIEVNFTGNKDYTFDLNSKNVLSHLGRVEILLADGDKQTDKKTKDIFFLKPQIWDDYDVTLYHFGPNPVPGTWPSIDSQLRRMHVTTLAAYTLEQSRQANYKVQAETRISGMESPDSGPDLAYYDSIKNKYLLTHDKNVLVRKYGLNDSSFLHSIKNELYQKVTKWRKFSPSAYYIYEEPSVTRYDDALDLDFSPVTLSAMRTWLADEYASLNALNKQWGTAFKTWREVVPDDTYEAQRRGNYSSWADHRTFMERSWAGQFKYVQDILHEIDPGGLVQLSGTQASGAHNGYDYSQIDKYVGQMNPYDIGNQLEYHHDFNPDLKISGQAGYGALGKKVLYDFYQHLFVNETGGAYIFWQQSALNPDLSFCKSALYMKDGFHEMRELGIGKLVALFKPENENKIAIHYSYPSIHGAWIVDGKIKKPGADGSSSETLEQFRRNLDGWVNILKDAGLGFDFISYSGIEEEELMEKGYSTLILPMSIALSDKEIRQIELFVKNGGTVISDAMPGVMDKHNKFRNKSSIAHLFGIMPASYNAQDITTPSSDKKLKAEGAKPFSSKYKFVQNLEHHYGKGKAFMLNYFLDQYPIMKAQGRNGATLLKLKDLFEKAGIVSSVTFINKNNAPINDITKYSFTGEDGKSKLLGLLPGENVTSAPLVIHMGSAMHVYDIRNAKYLGRKENITIDIKPLVPVLLALLPAKIESINVEPIPVTKPGDKVNVNFQIQLADSVKLNSVAAVSVYNPKGEKITYYESNCGIKSDIGHYDFTTALNELQGKWKVEIREVFSGLKAVKYFEVKNNQETLLPIPQQSTFTGNRFFFDNTWSIRANGLKRNLPAATSLQDDIENMFQIKLPFAENSKKKFISLQIVPGSVDIGLTVDTNKVALLEQAYQLTLLPDTINIIANAPQGLYYGVQSFLQLLNRNKEVVTYPEGEIKDWPEMNLRIIYWDDAHHLEKLDALKREIKQASYFKINGFGLKLEGHFQYKSAAPIVEPNALSAEEYQQLTNYAAAHYVQLIPYLDAPAHVSFVLKHPEYKDIRAFPNSNYQFTVNNPKTYNLLSLMFKELINANKGVDYVFLSNDEAYYTGKASNEIDLAKSLGGNGKLLAQFISRIADTLSRFGRKAIFWGEYPLTVDDIQKLPRNLINGVYDSGWAATFKKRGIRQLIYTSTQGEEPMFPNYYPIRDLNTLNPRNARLSARVPGLLKTITDAVTQQRGDIAGVIVAGWADAGLHPETFWLGYATGASMGWNYSGADADEFARRFFSTFYKSESPDLKKIYKLTSRQAQFFEDSWDWKPSTLRTPIFGNHAEIFTTPKPALDQQLKPLPVPDSNDLSINFDWADSNYKRLRLTEIFLKESDSLIALLDTIKVSQNQYNIEVIKTVAALCRQNLDMLISLEKINGLLVTASMEAKGNPQKALKIIDEALQTAQSIKERRNEVFINLKDVWFKDWLPLVTAANGRKYLHQVDDVKDHRPIRTIDLSYLIYRELNFPLEKWFQLTLDSRNKFALIHGLPQVTVSLNWRNYTKK